MVSLPFESACLSPWLKMWLATDFRLILPFSRTMFWGYAVDVTCTQSQRCITSSLVVLYRHFNGPNLISVILGICDQSSLSTVHSACAWGLELPDQFFKSYHVILGILVLC